MGKKRNQLFIIIGILLIMIISINLPYILSNTPFEYGGDLKPQWFPYFIDFKSIINFKSILQGIFPFYSWDLFLGTNFWASKSAHYVGDIFGYLSLLSPFHFYTIYEWITSLKVLIAGLTFFTYIGIFSKNTGSRIIGAISYAFSSWLIYFYGQGSFLSFYAWVPLYLLGIELYIKHKKSSLFLLFTITLLFTNYYFFFTLSVFTPIYYIYRYYLINESFKDFIKNTLYLILVYFSGVLVTFVLTLPTFYYMMQNDRIGSFPNTLFFDLAQIYTHILSGTFVPSQIFIYGNNVFETGYHISREITLWAGSLTAILIPQVLTDQDKKFKISSLILYLVLFFIIFSPYGNSMMHGFSEYSFRWTFLIIIINIMISQRYLSNIHLINRKTLIFTLFAIIVLINTIIPITLGLNQQFDLWLSDYQPQTILFLIVSFIFILFALLLVSKSKQKMFLLVFLTVLELSAYSVYLLGFLRREPLSTWDEVNNVTHVLQDSDNELNEYIKSLDQNNQNEFYRVYIPHDSLYWNYSHNQSVFYQLNGLMTYDSNYAPSLNALKKIAPQVMDFNSGWIFNIKDGKVVDFLNTKYAIVTNIDELPKGNYQLITDSFRGSLLIFRNLNYRPLGTSFSEVMSYEDFESIYSNDLSLLQTTIIAKSEDISQIKTYLTPTNLVTLNNISYYNNELHGDFVSDSLTFMIITLPYDPGWKILVDGTEVHTFDVNGGFIGIPIPAGSSHLDMYFIPQGFKVGITLTFIGLISSLTIFIFELRKRTLKV